jgi:lipoprotein-anchoring transpeptidase ErfK/SrfK
LSCFCRDFRRKSIWNNKKIIMPRRSHLCVLLLCVLPATAAAQGFGYPPERGDPYSGQFDDLYRDPDDVDYDRPTRAVPRRGAYFDERDPEAYPRGAARGRPQRGARVASLPSDADPAYSTPLDYDDQVDPEVSTRALIDDPTGQPAGTITIDTGERKLYLSVGGKQAVEYGVGVGRQGFAWKGKAQIGRKAFWPGWTPPKDMLLRRPDLPAHMEGGLDNPLGARALYLFNGNRDTLFRIHGTNEPDTIGQAVSSGCIRMLNADVIDLYRRVSKGARVVVR